MVLRFYRLAKLLSDKKIPLLPDLIYKFMRIVFACDIKYTVKIGKGVRFYHNGLGVVIHKSAIIGDDVSIYQNVTIGGNGKEQEFNGAPIIGNNVFIGAGAVVLGPITIGKNAKIGANSVVLNNVPSGRTVVGVPGRII